MAGRYPIADKIGWKGNSRCVIYECPNCHYDFNHYGHNENYCHHCGQQIEWTGMIEIIPDKIWDELEERCEDFDADEADIKRAFINTLNDDIRMGKVVPTDLSIKASNNVIVTLEEEDDD